MQRLSSSKYDFFREQTIPIEILRKREKKWLSILKKWGEPISNKEMKVSA